VAVVVYRIGDRSRALGCVCVHGGIGRKIRASDGAEHVVRVVMKSWILVVVILGHGGW
jgi:hypothetical protein